MFLFLLNFYFIGHLKFLQPKMYYYYYFFFFFFFFFFFIITVILLFVIRMNAFNLNITFNLNINI